MTGYQYGELLRTWFEVFFCGGEVSEDVQEHLRSTLEYIPDNCVASPDTLLRAIKDLATEITDIPIVSRMKRFIFRFICVAGKWVRQSRQWKLRLYTERPYEKLVAS